MQADLLTQPCALLYRRLRAGCRRTVRFLFQGSFCYLRDTVKVTPTGGLRQPQNSRSVGGRRRASEIGDHRHGKTETLQL